MSENKLIISADATPMTIADVVVREIKDIGLLNEVIFYIKMYVEREHAKKLHGDTDAMMHQDNICGNCRVLERISKEIQKAKDKKMYFTASGVEYVITERQEEENEQGRNSIL